MYITWKYDQFPYLLADKTVGKPDKDGYYATKNYGAMMFKPEQIIKSDKVGEKVKQLIEDQREEHRRLAATILHGQKVLFAERLKELTKEK